MGRESAVLHLLLELLLDLELLVDVPARMVLVESLEQVLHVLVPPALLVYLGLEGALLFLLHLLEYPGHLHVMVLVALHQLLYRLLLASPSHLLLRVPYFAYTHLSHLSVLLVVQGDDLLAEGVRVLDSEMIGKGSMLVDVHQAALADHVLRPLVGKHVISSMVLLCAVHELVFAKHVVGVGLHVEGIW